MFIILPLAVCELPLYCAKTDSSRTLTLLLSVFNFVLNQILAPYTS